MTTQRAPQPVLTLDRVVVEVAGRRALSRVDLEVGAGQQVALVGPSGAGKTTRLHPQSR